MGNDFLQFQDDVSAPVNALQDEKTSSLTKRSWNLAPDKEITLEQAFTRAEYVVNKTYLANLSTKNCVVRNDMNMQPVTTHTRFFKVDRIVYNKDENTLQKITSLYTAAHSIGLNPTLLLHSDGKVVDLYLGVNNVQGGPDSALSALYNNFQGNFPGSVTGECSEHCVIDTELVKKLEDWIGGKDSGNDAVAAVSGIPAPRREEEIDNHKYIQGLERVVDTMQGVGYTILILAQNVSPMYLHRIEGEYEKIYTALSPYSKEVYTFGENQSVSVGKSIADTVTKTIGSSESDTLSLGRSHSEGSTESTSWSIFGSKSAGAQAGVEGMGLNVGLNAGKSIGASFGFSESINTSDSVSSTTGHTTGTSRSESTGVSKGRIDTEGTGTSQSCQIERHNKQVEQMLARIDQHLKRIRQGQSYGMFGAAAYFISSNNNLVNTAASAYKAIISGQDSSAETASINTWSKMECPKSFENICQSLRHMQHPIFQLDQNNYVTPASLVNGYELAIAMGLPMKSIPGITVLEATPFGRNVYTTQLADSAQKDKTICIGNIFHMWEDEKTPVRLDQNSLTAHTLITGSTGSGKSNTVYQILGEARKNGVAFLVIEPAKGEYKHIFGSDPEVAVFGTNPMLTPMLRINPFSFPKEIHILEHLDRLIEIFNVCWPMYAAMPAVLKNAVEKSYVDCGWDLVRSKNTYDEKLYPSFADVARNIKEIIDTSEYDSDNKGAYKGSLLTRLQSLTNGINGMIFTCDEIADTDLFDKNVIIDLSRVGSSETKSLIMGMLVLKLQEHRTATATGMNEKLKHITVLEEAHNLLKRTSTEQASESANLQGKSVEMLANAIAEMRTYGEGFIIADQAPGLLDLSVIRNTNTKIIMRLPDRMDRELAGRAANLNDDQIIELAKLPCGVAAIYQNEWVQPVLCKVAKFSEQQVRYIYTPRENDEHLDVEASSLLKSLLDNIMNKVVFGNGIYGDMLRLKQRIIRSKLDTSVKKACLEYISSDNTDAPEVRQRLVYNLLSAKEAIEAAGHCNEITTWAHSVVDRLNPSIKDYSKEQIDLALTLILEEQANCDAVYNDFLVRFTETYKAKGGVF